MSSFQIIILGLITALSSTISYAADKINSRIAKLDTPVSYVVKHCVRNSAAFIYPNGELCVEKIIESVNTRTRVKIPMKDPKIEDFKTTYQTASVEIVQVYVVADVPRQFTQGSNESRLDAVILGSTQLQRRGLQRYSPPNDNLIKPGSLAYIATPLYRLPGNRPTIYDGIARFDLRFLDQSGNQIQVNTEVFFDNQ